MNGGERVADTLQAHRIPVLFTLCGGHISPILVAAKARGIRVVDTRHEATAVFAADALARLTGVPGVAAVTAGPGVSAATSATVDSPRNSAGAIPMARASPCGGSRCRG